MAVAQVGTTVTDSPGSSSVVSLTSQAAVDVGDLVMAVVCQRNNGVTITPDESGWTVVYHYNYVGGGNEPNTVAVWLRADDSGSTGYGFSSTAGSPIGGALIVFDGQDATTPIGDQVVGADENFGTTVVCSAVAGVAGGMLLCLCMSDSSSGSPFTPPVDMSEVWDFASGNMSMTGAIKALTATELTGDKTFIQGGSNRNTFSSIAIDPAAGGVDFSKIIDLHRRKAYKVNL